MLGFLFKHPDFPRSVRHCIESSRLSLERLPRSESALRVAGRLRRNLESTEPPGSISSSCTPISTMSRRRSASCTRRSPGPVPAAIGGEGSGLTPLSRNHSPAMVMVSISQEPVRVLPGKSQSLPTATRPANMRLRLPAMVISSTGYWISPFSTQKPAAPRE